MKIQGYEAYVKHQASNKLGPKSDKCYFVGRPKETEGYYFYKLIEGRVFIAQIGIFLKGEFIFRETNGRKIQLKEI